MTEPLFDIDDIDPGSPDADLSVYSDDDLSDPADCGVRK